MSKPEVSPEVRRLRHAVRYFYDLQQLRIQSGNRNSKHAPEAEVELGKHELEFMSRTADGLKALEHVASLEIGRALRSCDIYPWLKKQKGVGPTMAGVIIAEIDIAQSATPSALWRYCGLGVDNRDGKAERMRKGEKAHYNPWLKSKILEVLGSSFLKCGSPWREHYDNYKVRKQNQRVKVCMRCDGKGKVAPKDDDEETPKTKLGKTPKTAALTKCTNCDGKGGDCPWGRSDKHRHRAAMRFMVKHFLTALYNEWRPLRGLPVVPPYSESVLGRSHGDHGGAPVPTPPS